MQNSFCACATAFLKLSTSAQQSKGRDLLRLFRLVSKSHHHENTFCMLNTYNIQPQLAVVRRSRPEAVLKQVCEIFVLLECGTLIGGFV
jgi:hypothetical protein